MMANEDPETGDLHWLRSPVAKDASVRPPSDTTISFLPEHTPADKTNTSSTSLDDDGDDRRHDVPAFQRHDDATSAELFFDLFFAANLTVFSEVHEVSTRGRLAGYVGFFCLLWSTWALVALLDVRFPADGALARAARAGHLGVMIGFAVVAGAFHPAEAEAADAADGPGAPQEVDDARRTRRVLSFCLAASRLVLAAQYAAVAWRVRGYRRARGPLAASAGAHAAGALAYLGIGLGGGGEGGGDRVYAAWLALAGAEALLHAGASLASDVLSFRGTHLVRRMVLLTFVILGEGVVVICHSVTNIVVNSNAWTPATIGSVTAAVGTVYLVWMLYDDWQPRRALGPRRQLLWSCLHFPFHLALVLFVGGSAQFIVWFKIVESLEALPSYALVNPADDSLAFTTTTAGGQNVTRAGFLADVGRVARETFALFPPRSARTGADLAWCEDALAALSDAFWGNLTDPREQARRVNAGEVDAFVRVLTTLDNVVVNSLFETFRIDALDEVAYTNPVDFEQAAYDANTDRFEMVLIYAFVSAGAVLLLMSLLLVVRRAPGRGWGRLRVAQLGANVVVGLGLALSALVVLSDAATTSFMLSPWVLPVLCLTFFVVLVLNHLPRSPPSLPRFRLPGGRTAKTSTGRGGPEEKT